MPSVKYTSSLLRLSEQQDPVSFVKLALTKPRTRTRVSLASRNNKMDAGCSRTGTLVISSMQLKFCIDAPSNVRYHELINYRRRTADRDTPHPDVAYFQMMKMWGQLCPWRPWSALSRFSASSSNGWVFGFIGSLLFTQLHRLIYQWTWWYWIPLAALGGC